MGNYYFPNTSYVITYICTAIQLYSATHNIYAAIQGYTPPYRAIQNYTKLYTALQGYSQLYTTIQSYRGLYRAMQG